MKINITELLSRDNNIIKCIFTMVSRGDYTLEQAILIFMKSCDRCRQVLLRKYLGDKYGYNEFSYDWRISNATCDFCENEEKEHLLPIEVSFDKIEDTWEARALRCMGTKPTIKTFISDTDGNGHIIHTILIYPYEIYFEYIIYADNVLYNSVKQRDEFGNICKIIWDCDSNRTFRYEDKNKDFILPIRSWDEYFDIKEVKDYINKKRKENNYRNAFSFFGK